VFPKHKKERLEFTRSFLFSRISMNSNHLMFSIDPIIRFDNDKEECYKE
jgi:hypothetical protein